MWLEKKKYQEIRTALQAGAQAELDRVLHDIAAREKGSLQVPARCPVCHKELKRGPLPYLEFFGAACPDFHGWWISPEISQKLRDFIREQISLGVKKARQLKMLIAFLIGVGGIFFLSGVLSSIMPSHSRPSETAILLPMPSRAAAVQSADEWSYLSSVAVILENGITNRMSFEDVFKKRVPPENRWKAFNLYRVRQSQLIEKLRVITVPSKLQALQVHLLHAFENQIVFYAAMTHAGGAGQLDREAQPAFKALHQDLTAAYNLILESYPTLDPQTRAALQERFLSLEGG